MDFQLSPANEFVYAIIVGTATAVGILLKILWGMKQDLQQAKEEASVAADATRNGGTSMRDGQNRIEAKLETLTRNVQALADRQDDFATAQTDLAVQVREVAHNSSADIRGLRKDLGRALDDVQHLGRIVHSDNKEE